MCRLRMHLTPNALQKWFLKNDCLECFCTPSPLGLPWFPKACPRVPSGGLLGAFGWFCALWASLGAPSGILGLFLGALCISWMLLGPSSGILAFLWVAPWVFLVCRVIFSSTYKHMHKSGPRLVCLKSDSKTRLE